MTTRNKIILVLIPLTIIGIILLIKVREFKSYTLNSANMENTIMTGDKVRVKVQEFSPKRFDIISYIDPEYDTIIVPLTFPSYYAHVRLMGRDQVKANFEIKHVPLEENKERWIGRCVGLPGDTIYIQHSDLYINSKLYDHEKIKKTYVINTEEYTPINPKQIEKIGISKDELYVYENKIIITATISQLMNLFITLNMDNDTAWCQQKESEFDPHIFPFSANYRWNQNYFGPLTIPKKDSPISLTISNLPIYQRLIFGLEMNELKVIDSTIYINGKVSNAYTPKMDYYFIINDNRDNSVDSRMWGFLPKTHIVGKVIDF